ncbi:hypothetical protein pipiens_011549 [Culex pipiens pipiens]|uniref:Uncharacterized protein n=1 Tax=Culex pipiens pipiens TaxID=38569 RepID=A0ABD1D6E2_CULPP
MATEVENKPLTAAAGEEEKKTEQPAAVAAEKKADDAAAPTAAAAATAEGGDKKEGEAAAAGENHAAGGGDAGAGGDGAAAGSGTEQAAAAAPAKKEKEVKPTVHKANFEKDVVYLYQFTRTPLLPSMSPYCLKVETWLRLAGLKYEKLHQLQLLVWECPAWSVQGMSKMTDGRDAFALKLNFHEFVRSPRPGFFIFRDSERDAGGAIIITITDS